MLCGDIRTEMVDHEICNVLVLNNLCKYHPKSYIAKNRFFLTAFCCRQYRSIFNRFDIVGSQTY